MLMLWKSLLSGKRQKAISIPHTTATQMGTDWRYNDEQVERLVEMFQGNRDSYEYLGGPPRRHRRKDRRGRLHHVGRHAPEGICLECPREGLQDGVHRQLRSPLDAYVLRGGLYPGAQL